MFPASCSLFETCGMNYNLTLKGHVENRPQVQVMTWQEKVMLHISRSVSLAWTYLWCFNHSSWSLSKVFFCRKTTGDLSWPEITLATLAGFTGRNIPNKGVKSTCNSMFESVYNSFRPEEAPKPFNFLPLTYNGGHKIALILGQRFKNSEICMS